MANTLTYGSTVLALPDDLLWPNEFDWKPADQVTSFTIFGALRVEAAEKLAGRPITLQGGENFGWIDRSGALTLNEWAKLPAQVFTLSYRGDTYSVVFDQESTPVTARQVYDVSDPEPTDPYTLTLRFIEV